MLLLRRRPIAGQTANEFDKDAGDGGPDYASYSGSLGLSDSKLWSCAFFFKLKSAATNMTFFGGGDDLLLTRWRVGTQGATSDKVFFLGHVTPATGVLNYTTAATFTSTTVWNSILFSVDLSDTGKRHVYVNDAVDSGTWTTYTDSVMSFSEADRYRVGDNIVVASVPLDAYISHVWDFPGKYIDWSIEANRRCFVRPDLTPAPLLIDGSCAASASPTFWFPDGDPTNNRGTGPDLAYTSGAKNLVDGPGA